MTISDLRAMQEFLDEHSKHCPKCGLKRITTRNNEWPLRQQCLDCRQEWLEYENGTLELPMI